MKKIIIVLVFISLVSLLVTGCGQKATETPVTVNEETSEKETVSNNEETTAEESSVEEVQEATEKAEETEEGGEKSISKGVTDVADSNGTSESVSVSNGQGSVGYSTSNGSSNTGVNVGTNTSNSNTTPKEKKPEPVKQPEEPKVEEPKVEEPKTEEPKIEEPKIEETKIEEPKTEPTQPQGEKPKMDLKAMSKEELDNLLDSIYPGDSLTEEWKNRLPAMKMYSYFGKKYGNNFFNYIRTDAVVIDSTTVECTAIVKLGDGGEKTHKVRLKVDNNGFWSIISDVAQ